MTLNTWLKLRKPFLRTPAICLDYVQSGGLRGQLGEVKGLKHFRHGGEPPAQGNGPNSFSMTK